MRKIFNLLIVAVVAAMSFSLASCSDDTPTPANGGLKVNGQDWGLYNDVVPYYQDAGFYYLGISPTGQVHSITCYAGIIGLKVGETVNITSIVLGDDNAEYKYESGSVTVSKVQKGVITLSFNNYKIKYVGPSMSSLGDNRGDDIAGLSTLTLSGEVPFSPYSI